MSEERFLTRADSDRIMAEVTHRIVEGAKGLTPKLIRLARRNPAWGEAEEAEWADSVREVFARVMQWNSHEIARCSRTLEQHAQDRAAEDAGEDEGAA